MIELTQQMRAALDVDHMNFLNQMTMPRPGQPRINAYHTKKLQTLTPNDIKGDTLWHLLLSQATKSGWLSIITSTDAIFYQDLFGKYRSEDVWFQKYVQLRTTTSTSISKPLMAAL